MRPVDFTLSFAAADPDGLVTLVIINGDATLNGALTSGGVGTFDPPRAIDVVGQASVDAVNFTVTGTDRHGNALVETFLGPAGATTTTSVNSFSTITAISTDATTTVAVTVGSSDQMTTQWIPLDHYQADFNVAVAVSLVDAFAGTWGIERTLSDVQAVGFNEGDAIVSDVLDTALLAQTDTANDGTITNPCEAIRGKITSHTVGGIRMQVQQAGY